MTIRPAPRRFGQDDLDDVFSAIIPPSDAATSETTKASVKFKKMDPLQKRLSMSAQRRNEAKNTENVTAKPTRTPKVSFSPYNRHHPYNPALRVASSLKQAVSYTTSAPTLGEGATRHILAHATPLRPNKHIPQTNSAGKDSITISTIGSSSIVGSTPQAPNSSRSSDIHSPGELLPTPSGPTTSTPLNRNPLQPYNTAPGSISLVKSILKRNRGTPIRLAATVEEGTQENTEQARWGSSSPTKDGRTSTRPALKAADSFQLLVTRSALPHAIPGTDLSARKVTNATAEGVDGTDVVPGSDDTIVSDDAGNSSSSEENAIPGNGNNEEAQPGSNGDDGDRRLDARAEASSIPDDGAALASSVDSLLDIIIHEADDLMAVEDAYNLIQVRYRKLFAQSQIATTTADDSVLDPASDLVLALDRFQKCSSDIYRSFIRDISRLVGTPISSIPPPVLDSSPPPDEHLDPTQGEITPSPSPEPNARLANFNQHSRKAAARVPASPTFGIARLSSSSNPPSSPNPTRQGYSEAEVRYRRALAGVGQSSLRFLAFVFHRSELYQCFSDADITSLISSVLVIPNTPKLHTPNPKKSYALAMYSLCHLKVPVTCVQPIKEKMMRVLTYGLGEGGLKCWGGGPGKREGEGGNVKARFECFAAMANALVQYPSLFIPRHKDLIPLILGGLTDSQQGMKVKAGMALCGFMKGKMNWLRDTERALKEVHAKLAAIDEEEPAGKERVLTEEKSVVQEWKWARKAIEEAEATTVTVMKSNIRSSLVVNPQRAKFSDVISDLIKRALATDPLWACAIWACLVSMMGQGFLKESVRYRDMNSLVLSVLGDKEQQEKCAGRTTLCSLAWNHTIHAIFNYRSQQYIREASATSCKYYDVNYPLGDKMMTAILSLPSEVRRIEGMIPETAKIVTNAEGKLEWSHAQTVPMRAWLELCANSITPIIYAYTGAIMRCTPREDQADSVQNDPATQATLTRERLGKIFDDIVMVFLPSMLDTKALDGITTEAWGILSALVQYTPSTKLKSWSMSRLLCEAFFRNETVNRDLTPSYRDRICLEAAGEMMSSGIRPNDIPALDNRLICSKFVGGFGTLFVSAVTSLRGIEKFENTGEWIKISGAEDDALLMPKIIADIWETLLHHVSSQAEDGRVLHQSLAEVTRILVELYKMDVALYTPIFLENDPLYDPEARRIQMYHFLGQICVKALGNKFSQTRLTLNTPAQWSNTVDASSVITADASGNPTPAGYLLQHLLHTGSESTGLSERATKSFVSVFRDLTIATCTGVGGKQTLGQLSSILTTSHLSDANNDIAWGIWTVLCQQWSALLEHISPSTRSTSSPDNTLLLLTNLLSLPFKLSARNPAKAPESWTSVWEQLFDATNMRCEARQQPYQLSLLEPICKSIIALEDWLTLVFRVDSTWSCVTVLAFSIKPTQLAAAEFSMSYLSMVDQLVNRHSSAHLKVSRLLSAALSCCDAASLQLDVVERLWCAALSTHLTSLNIEAQTALNRMASTASRSSAPAVKETLERFSPIFCHLLQTRSIRTQDCFRIVWNASFGEIDLNDNDIPSPLLAMLRDRWETDPSLFDMPAWKKAREASQAARRAISTADYEADRSNEAESSTMRPSAQILSETSESRSQLIPSSSPNGISDILPDSQGGDTEVESKAERRKARSSSKRSGQKQRNLKRSSQAAIEPEEESQSQPAKQPRSKGLKDVTTTRESKRQKTSRSNGNSVSSPLKPADESLASSSSPSRRSDRLTSGRFIRKASRPEVLQTLRREAAPAQKKKAEGEAETVIPRPEQPEDRVEVVLPALSQRQRDSADSADREQILVRQPAFARKRSLMPEFARALRASEDFDRPPSRPSFSRSRVLSKTVSNPEHMRQQSLAQSSSRPASPTQDVFALIQQAAQLKHTIRDLDDGKINDLLGTLEVLRSTGQKVLTDRYDELRQKSGLGKK
ncbi:hypothetical protein QFC22_004644 [Naganishia vaughanmartiniae]|uniref:Uncharacterized protein n=1 Tax=Naganishia vaughanmartiniae TaxID=1424756 RepID=A0ACC2X0Q7_9TREE|nr:hypothetical protein QFC22_004644 [Naganishia vaughanmartiniae]